MRRLARLARRIVLSNLADLKVPYKLTYALTYRCQFSCAMCGIGNRAPVRELSAGEIEAFLRGADGLSWIHLSGGEIFLRDDLPEIMGIIAHNCPGIYLLNFPTNGFLTDRIVGIVDTVLASYRFPRVVATVSLDGPPRMHDRLRNMPGAWDRAVETFRALRLRRSRRFNVYFGMTLQEANADAFEESILAVNERIGNVGPADIHVNLQHASPHYYGTADHGRGDRERLSAALRRIRRRRRTLLPGPAEFLEHRYQAMAERYLASDRSPVPCQALAASFFLDPEGNVYPCTIHDRPVGNLREYDYALDRLWNAVPRRSLRAEIRNGACPSCWTPCEAYQSILANILPFAAG